ncbi:MAG: helix-turn-helix domain-containing protein [Fibrobacteres bacterium]|nr:helix-turn-helix domain-containing protein [Fibrobacterota bacterium]
MLLFILLIILSADAYVDTVPPVGSLTNPKPFTVLTGNVVQFSAEASDSGGSGVKEVRYYGTYYRVVDSSEQGERDTFFLGKSDVKPYLFRWDCSDLPDQDEWRMSFYCVIEDSAGNVNKNAGGALFRSIVLDRKPQIKELVWHSKRVHTKKKIDGLDNDWQGDYDTLHFLCNDNSVDAISAWDDKAIYMLVNVKDNALWKKFEHKQAGWWFDALQFHFDPLRDRSEFRKVDDRQLDICMPDISIGNIIDFEAGIKKSWDEGYEYALKVHGSLNDDSDADTGYTVEVAFFYEGLGMRSQRSGDSLGFDLFMQDIDFKTPYGIAISWAGNERCNNNNPSEWGTLVLAESQSLNWIVIWLVVALMATGLGIVIRVAVRKEPTAAIKETVHPAAERIIKYIKENASNSDLDLTSAAEALRMSSSSLRHTLKKLTDKSFSDHLTEIRMNNARKLLREKAELNIGEVAAACGYSSLEYFAQAFKRENDGLSPSQYKASKK